MHAAAIRREYLGVMDESSQIEAAQKENFIPT
jgi:hypothetical protein